MYPHRRIGVLGPLEVRDADGQLVPVGGVRLRSFLIRLAVGDGSPVSVDRLAEDLWPREQPADASNAVQALASRLRAVAGRDLIEYGPTGYRLAVPADQVDAGAFEQLVASGRIALERGDEAAGVGILRAALQLWRGPALADVADAAFAAPAIARLTELMLAATEDRIDADLALGRGGELVPEVEQLAAEHPLRERLRGQLMQALCAAGRQADALSVFEETRRTLADALGIDPSPSLGSLHVAILRGELPAGQQLAPTGRQGTRRGNLPAQLTSFVGRDDDLSRVTKLLQETRLITLTGPGGAGKTRLAVEAAARLTVPDGVWFVPLAPVRDALEVPQAVLSAVDGHDAGWPADKIEAARLAGLSPLDRLSETLGGRELVLVLDNCEHLIDAAATMAARLLADAPAVRILATSREPLGITGETLSPVPSLPLPADGAGPAELAANAAVRLFADRAAAVRPGFEVTSENADAVSRICRALDGIPLAIELAAARIRALTPGQVADRLDDRFALLSVGSRGMLPRHQTLRAIVDWSWELLDETERTVLRRLSVFSGGATPDSAQQVCWPDTTVDVVGVIASLLDKSLVTAAGDQQVRYRLLETVRVYAADRLAEAGETEAVSAGHARYFLDLAERVEPKLRTREQLGWLVLMAAEHDNFSAALRSVVQAGDGVSALRFVGALAWYWITHDHDAEAREWATAAVRIAPAEVPPELTSAYAVSKLVAIMSSMAAEAGRPPHEASQASPASPAAPASPIAELRQALAELPAVAIDAAHPLLALAGPMLAAMGGNEDAVRDGLERIAAHPDPWVRAARRLISGHLAINAGDIDGAEADLTAGQAEFEQIGDRFGIMVCLSGLAEVATARNTPAEAVRLLEHARSLSLEGLAGHWTETVLVPLGMARAAAGDVRGGRAEIERAVQSAERFGELDDAARGYLHLADLDRKAGDLPAAQEQAERALAIVEPRERRADIGSVAAVCFSKLGCLAEQRGELDTAARWHRRALALMSDSSVLLLQSNQVVAIVTEGAAALQAARGDHEGAARSLGLAHTLQGHRSHQSIEAARVEAASTLSLGDFEQAYAAGRALRRPDALALLAVL